MARSKGALHPHVPKAPKPPKVKMAKPPKAPKVKAPKPPKPPKVHVPKPSKIASMKTKTHKGGTPKIGPHPHPPGMVKVPHSMHPIRPSAGHHNHISKAPKPPKPPKIHIPKPPKVKMPKIGRHH